MQPENHQSPAGADQTPVAEVEATVLALLLEFWERIPDEQRARIRTAMFSDQRNACIFETVLRLESEHVAVDIASVFTALQTCDSAQVERAGGAHYISGLPERFKGLAVTPENIGYHIDQLEAQYRARERETTLRTVVASLQRSDVTPEEILKAAQALEEIEQPRQCRHIQVLSVGDIIKYSHNPDDDMIGDGWVSATNATVITGGTGIGKSVFVMQLACSLASGLPFLGRLPIHRPVVVLMVEAEDTTKILQRNLSSMMCNLDLPVDVVTRNLTFVRHSGDTPERFGAWLAAEVRTRRPAVVILDPLQPFLAGDMNDSATAFRFRDAVAPVIQSHGCALVLSAHPPKSRNMSGVSDRESVHYICGHSSFGNWVRAGAEIFESQVEGDERLRLHFSKNAELTGLKDAQGHILREIFIVRSSDYRVPYWRIADSQEQIRQVDVLRDRVLACIREEGGANVRLARIAVKMGIEAKRVSEITTLLVGEGILTEEKLKSPGSPKIFSIAEGA